MFKRPITTTIIAATAVTILTSPVLAKDWIEKVDIQPDGIDTKPIEVTANINGYQSVKKSKHQFKLRLYAKAKKNKRIVAGKVGSAHPVYYWEHDGANRWITALSQQAVAGGKKQSISYSYRPNVPVNKVLWQGNNPVQACKSLMQQKISKGHSKTAVLGKTWNTSAYAYFEFDAVAAKKKNAQKNNWKFKNTTSQRKSMTYRVTVKCHAGIKRASS
ncbi:MAG: hypothetical protein AAF478_09895 [Pseudomonadota bacterium]